VAATRNHGTLCADPLDENRDIQCVPPSIQVPWTGSHNPESGGCTSHLTNPSSDLWLCPVAAVNELQSADATIVGSSFLPPMTLRS
jgi:hypothetical protein